MTTHAKTAELDLERQVAEILDENYTMAIATLRADGWPQATVVGYVRHGLTLYFAVARISQKLENIRRDPRISIALGHRVGDRLRGLSIAARAVEVTDPEEVKRVNEVMQDRYSGEVRLSPREHSSVLLKVEATLVSVVDVPEGAGEPQLSRMCADGSLAVIPNPDLDRAAPLHPPEGAAAGDPVWVRSLGPSSDFYRPGAPF